MNFIEYYLDEFVEENLDEEKNKVEINLLEKFKKYIDKETEIYSVQDMSQEDVEYFLRTLRNKKDKENAVNVLNKFFKFLNERGELNKKIELSIEKLFKGTSETVKSNLDMYDDYDDEDDYDFK